MARRPLSYRTKLLFSHIALVAIVLLLVSLLLERFLAADLERRQQDRLVEQARGATEWVTSGRHPNRVAVRLAAIVQADVQIFDPDDCIVGSSHFEGDRAPEPQRPCVPPPEVKEARTAGVSHSKRVSGSGEDRFDYVAVRTDDLVVQLGVSTRDIDAHISAMRERLAIAGVIAAILAVALGQVAAQLAARPLRSMARQADRIARGEYDVKLPALARDEFGQLGDTLSSLGRQLKGDMDRIRKLEITRRDFVANVTHELRTPIAAIQAGAETLQGDVSPEQAKRFVDMMHKHAQRISGLVDGLLRLADLEAGEGEAPRDSVDLLAAARETVQTLARRMADASVTIELDIAEGTMVLGEQTRLEQVLENLVDNAIKYGRHEGRVKISAVVDDDRVTVRVEDDGPGIAPEHLDRIFERFYRVDAGRSRERGGAGLGLAIVKHLVESMGGSITVESEVGRGTTFVVILRSASVAD